MDKRDDGGGVSSVGLEKRGAASWGLGGGVELQESLEEEDEDDRLAMGADLPCARKPKSRARLPKSLSSIGRSPRSADVLSFFFAC